MPRHASLWQRCLPQCPDSTPFSKPQTSLHPSPAQSLLETSTQNCQIQLGKPLGGKGHGGAKIWRQRSWLQAQYPFCYVSLELPTFRSSTVSPSQSNRDKRHLLDPLWEARQQLHSQPTASNWQWGWEWLPELGNISSDKIRFDLRDCSKHQLNSLWCSESHQTAQSFLFLALKSVSLFIRELQRPVFLLKSLVLFPWSCCGKCVIC